MQSSPWDSKHPSGKTRDDIELSRKYASLLRSAFHKTSLVKPQGGHRETTFTITAREKNQNQRPARQTRGSKLKAIMSLDTRTTPTGKKFGAESNTLATELAPRVSPLS